jgi:hypothetical protein
MALFSANSETTGRKTATALIKALLPVRTELRGISNLPLAPRHGAIRMAQNSQF